VGRGPAPPRASVTRRDRGSKVDAGQAFFVSDRIEVLRAIDVTGEDVDASDAARLALTETDGVQILLRSLTHSGLMVWAMPRRRKMSVKCSGVGENPNRR
jgi:hypothetical protein